jgi:hypothetical protein
VYLIVAVACAGVWVSKSPVSKVVIFLLTIHVDMAQCASLWLYLDHEDVLYNPLIDEVI